MIWIGGVALALGGGFIVKYSIDAGLLSPSIRVILGTLFGLVLTPLGEYVRRRREDLPWFKDQPDYLPNALSAAGLFTLYASIYMAYGFYNLIGPILAFASLAMVSLSASYVGILQGRFFAYLGLAGSLISPAIVSSSEPSAWVLFPYLLFAVGASLYVARERAWADLAATGFTLAPFWALAWIMTNWHAADVLPVGLYVLILGFINGLTLRGATPLRLTESSVTGLRSMHPVTFLSDIVAAVCIGLLFIIVRLDHYGTLSLVLFSAAFISYLYAMIRNAEYDVGALITLAASLLLLLSWHLPKILPQNETVDESHPMFFALSPIAAPGFETFVITAALLAGIVGFLSYYCLPYLLRKPLWASVGVAYPISVLIIVYGRLNDFDVSLPYAAISLAMGAAFTGAVIKLRRGVGFDADKPIAAYASGATIALSLALAMALRDAWLSFALTLEIAALGYIWRQTRVTGLRWLAMGLSGIVLIRLFLNVQIFGYGGAGALPIINWLFYAYGLGAAALALAAKLFEEDKATDRLVSGLKIGFYLLGLAFISLEIRVLFGENGRIDGVLTHLEAMLQTINWTAASLILYWRSIKDDDELLRLFSRGMTTLSVLALIYAGGGYNNLLINSYDVGTAPIWNFQLLQYLIPAILYGVKARLALKASAAREVAFYSLIAGALSFLWLTLEVRHYFHPSGGFGSVSDWELYSYSLAWLFYGGAALFAGIQMQQRAIRLTGVAILGLVIGKVFLVDMSALEGIARALSFIGLGATLIGMGYLYQRLNYRDKD